MSNLVPVNVQVPAHLANRIGKPTVLAQSLMGGISSGESFPRISIKGSRFRIVDGDAETVLNTVALDVVIVGANPRLSKTWYEKPWDPDSEPSAPDCFSLDGVSPHIDSATPQNDLCASCPQNAWGSRVTPQGQQVKACADQKRLAVVAADDAGGPVYLLQVTPAALKGLNQYQKELAMRGIPPEIVKTTVSFDTDASFPKLKFGFGGFIEPDVQAVVDELFGAARVLEITGEKAAATPEVPAIEKPKPAAVKAVEPEPAPEPAPEPKRGFAAAAEPAEPVTKPKAAPKAETKSSDGGSLADEIAALLGEVGTDD